MIELFIYGGAIIFTIWYLDRHHYEQGFLFYKLPFLAPKGTFGSAPNPRNIIQGYAWIDYRDLKNKFKDKKNTVYLNNFRFFEHFLKKSKISKSTQKRIEKNTRVSLDPNKLTQGVCIMGATGTGKSEEYYNLISQKWYQRALIHDIKQDFIKFYYRRNKDIIYNGGLDKRSHIWDVMSESPHVQQAFFTNLLSSMLGEKKDYFSQAAQKKFSDTTKAITSIYQSETTPQKWMYFITAIKDLISDMEKGESKSDSDVSKTMEQILEIFEMSAYFIVQEKRKTFVIEDFFKRDKQAKLYLSNVEAFQSALTPIFTGFIAAFTMVHASLDSYAAKKGNYTFYLLDEYLGFLKYMDEATVDRIHLRLRSYGCCPVSGLQKLPEKKELRDTLLSSNYLLLYFAGSGDDVVKSLEEKIKKTDYWYEEKNISIDSKGKKSKSYSKQQKNLMLFSNDMIHGLGEDYSHIAFFPLLRVIYKGYTPQVATKQIAKDLMPANLNDFYKLKFKDFEARKVDSFADVFEKKLSKLDEYKLFKKFEKAKKENKILEFKKKNKILEEFDLELLFEKFIVNEQVVSNKMKLLTVDDRFNLKKEWDKLDDEAAQLEFIEKNELFGALPNLFDLDETEVEIVEDNW